MKNPQFDLENFSQVNIQRCNSPQGFNVPDKQPTYFGSGIMEEAGEVGGILKKIERGFNSREKKKIYDAHVKNWEKNHDKSIKHQYDLVSDEEWEKVWLANLRNKLSDEMADLFTMMDLVATKFDVNLFQSVKRKFNQVSEEMKCPQFKIENIDVNKNQEESH